MAKNKGNKDHKSETVNLVSSILDYNTAKERLVEITHTLKNECLKNNISPNIFRVQERVPYNISTELWRRIIVITMLLTVYLVVLSKFQLILVIYSVLTLLFFAGKVPIEESIINISDTGLEIYGKMINWESVSEYWFSIRGESYVLNVRHGEKFGLVLSLVIDKSEMLKIYRLLNVVAKYRKTPRIYMYDSLVYGKFVDSSLLQK